MRDLGLVVHDEPITRLFTQGMVQKGGVAMSKSRGNVVGAIDMAEKYGSDTGRMYTLFAAPPEKDLEWSEKGIEGAARFLHRVYRLIDKHSARLHAIPIALDGQIDVARCTEKEKILIRKTHQTLKRVTVDFESRWHFNSSVALIMEAVNELYAHEPLDAEVSPEILKGLLATLLLMLFPMTPHIAAELWEMLGLPGMIADAAWPKYREELAREEQVEVIVQVNGRLRGKILVDDSLSAEETLQLALGDPRISLLIDGKQIVKKIVVPKKLVNLVLK
jgi:leucyl-tRNA synthetase